MAAQQKRSLTTRAKLCSAYRKSLLDKGLAETTTDSVLAQTGLSKGAMYHHFKSKDDIIEAIYRDESHGAIRRAVASVPAGLPAVERLKRACHAWLGEMENPGVAKIVLAIGPAALGYQRVIEVEAELSLRLFEQVLGEGIATGEIDLAKPALAARLVNGMMAEIASQPQRDRADAARTIDPGIDAILAGLATQA